MKILLSIETTGIHLGLSLFSFDPRTGAHRKKAARYSKQPFKQSETLFPQLTLLMKRNRVKKNDLGLIAVDVGPGSFTGVRVGISAARALAQGLKLPLIGVTSLEAMAHAQGRRLGLGTATLAPLIPALANEVYGAVYTWTEGVLRVDSPPKWEAAERFRRRLKSGAAEVTSPPHPDAVAELALKKWVSSRKGRAFPYERVKPLYLQPSWAERCSPSAR